MKNVCLFGASGTLGQAIMQELTQSDFNVLPISSSKADESLISTLDLDWPAKVSQYGEINGVVWAQGVNANDSILTFDRITSSKHLDANVLYIAETLNLLLINGLLKNGARLVVLSSIWQEASRQNKFSYTVSKSAIRGLVGSLTLDLGPLGISINAILPGVIDTPMTRSALSESQIDHVISETPLAKLASADEVAKIARWLVSEESKGVNGQFLTIDNGWSRFRNV